MSAHAVFVCDVCVLIIKPRISHMQIVCLQLLKACFEIYLINYTVKSVSDAALFQLNSKAFPGFSDLHFPLNSEKKKKKHSVEDDVTSSCP